EDERPAVGPPGDRRGVPLRQVVVRDRLVPVLQHVPKARAADIPRTAGHQNLHPHHPFVAVRLVARASSPALPPLPHFLHRVPRLGDLGAPGRAPPSPSSLPFPSDPLSPWKRAGVRAAWPPSPTYMAALPKPPPSGRGFGGG